MASPQPFDPDADYCVYCHAPAAGPCAHCRALCCGDCVELVMGWTTRRAVCHPCHAKSPPPARPGRMMWLGLAAAAATAALLLHWAGAG